MVSGQPARPSLPIESARSPSVPGRPIDVLRDVIVGDYRGFTEATAPEGGFVLPATASVPVVIKIRDSPLRPPVFVNGPHGSFTTVTGNCAPVYLEFELAPLAAFGVLGMPLDRPPDQPSDLVDVLGPEGRRVGEKVRSVETWNQRFAFVDAFLLDRLDRAPRLSPEVVRAWSLLEEGRGQTQVSGLAEDVGWSHKHLITKFREQLGLPPKTAARLIRFGHVRRLLADGRFGLARIAAEAGFSDQPHLTREIRQFTGNTPSEFLRAAGVVNSLQDAGRDAQ